MIIHGSETRHTSTHTFIQVPPPLKYSVIKRCQHCLFERLSLVYRPKSMMTTFAFL